jgi:ADP-ribose pyrophosphatase YjhB (NUDIX family)
VGAVVLDGDLVLLVKRGGATLLASWSIPGGLVELGETTREAVSREIAEECGIEIELIDVLRSCARTGSCAMRRAGSAIIGCWWNYLAVARGGTLCAGDDAADARMVRIDEVAQYDTTDGLMDMIKRAMALRERGNFMKVEVVAESLGQVKADALVVGVSADDKKLSPVLAALDRQAGGRISAVLTAERFTAKPGVVTHLHVADGFGVSRIVLAGVGGRKDSGAEMVRPRAAAGLRRARDLGARVVALEVLGDRLPPRERAHAAVEGAILGTYVFDRYKREKNEKIVETLRVMSPDGRQTREVTEGARRGEIFAQSTWLARDLINAPANDVHPTHVADVAKQVAREAS